MQDTPTLPADGGPAFPSYEKFEDGHLKVTKPKSDGITVRDYFAAKVLHALFDEYANQGETPEVMARDAYKVADAMLAERAKAGESET